MTIDEKKEVVKLRKAGYGYSRIADALGISKNTIKAFCRRNDLRGQAEAMPDITITDAPVVKSCRHCGKPVVQTPGRKEKKFCNDTCRNRYWNSHLSQVK